MMIKNHRTPDHYLPGVQDIFWLISESPRGKIVLDIWHGYANAVEIASCLWTINPHIPVSYPEIKQFSMEGISTSQWIEEVLTREATPCVLGGSGRIQKIGNDFVVPITIQVGFHPMSLAAGNGRPYLLPKWIKN